MINIQATASVYVLHEPISFHRQINGLAAAVRQQMGKDPVSGSYFVFRSRDKKSIRILHFDGSGIWLCTKRLSRGCFSDKIWPKSLGDYSPILVRDLQQLLWGEMTGHSYGGKGSWRKIA